MLAALFRCLIQRRVRCRQAPTRAVPEVLSGAQVYRLLCCRISQTQPFKVGAILRHARGAFEAHPNRGYFSGMPKRQKSEGPHVITVRPLIMITDRVDPI